ncbi:hypothetical protein GWI33_015961 [Rhynchophorus ferrugineus]|uniref:Transmembrane protein n=1 Tax=Rhynchophorus ferrugineus TaxID=354439 RepID=A0A834I4F1_RHYFE|nr:hypothetical protein GWI33_015961 [Rhynchophorus ferrugineus]
MTVKSVMVHGCKKLWTALQILWSSVYIVCGAFQLMASIFFLVSVHELTLYGVLVAGSWNIIIGIAGSVVACITVPTVKRQETLLYLAVSILAVNSVVVIQSEWKLYFTDMPNLLNKYSNHVLIDYALFVLRTAIATVLLVAFLDSQFAFCSAQTLPNKKLDKLNNKKRKAHGSHDQVSDIEYIIPRTKSAKSPQSHQVYDAYAQSWVFDTDSAGCSNGSAGANETSYLRILQNGTPKNPLGRPAGLQNGTTVKTVTHLIDNPVVHIEEASDDSTSNSDRKLCHMKSFSRSASPIILSASSSQVSLTNYNPVTANPPIYEYLEKLTEPQIYRSRLNTAVSRKSEEEEDTPQYQAPQSGMMRRVETVSPQVVEPVQYASLMKELQRAIVSKKEPPSVTSPLSNSESQSHSKSSDTEFSKELEAALQLIQDLESPNTVDTPSDPQNSRPLAVWRKNSEPSESEKTLSAVGSMAEIASPLADMVAPQDRSPPSTTGKAARVLVRYPDSQSTSGYSSPSHGPTPNWSTTSSLSGSNNDIVKPVSYHVHNAKSTTVISLYSQPNEHSKGKSVTLVRISGECDPLEHSKSIDETPIHCSTFISDSNPVPRSPNSTLTSAVPPTSTTFHPQQKPADTNNAGIWNVKSLLRKKKQHTVPKLCPELEGAIVKSESLAYLSEVELLARARRNEEIQRQIEERVIQQLGMPRAESESNC